MPQWLVLSVLLAGSPVAAAKMPPKPAALRPAFILSQEKPEQPPKLALAALNVGRLRGGDSPDTDRVGTACTLIARPARLLLITAVFCLLRDASRRFTPQYATHWTAPAYAIMQFIIVVEWLFVALPMAEVCSALAKAALAVAFGVAVVLKVFWQMLRHMWAWNYQPWIP